MVRNGHAGRGFVCQLGKVCTLNSFFRILEGVEIAGGQCSGSLGAHHHSSVLDDLEHLGDTVVDITHEPADGRNVRRSEGELASWGRLETHLVLDAGDVHAVALSQFKCLRVEMGLRNVEQAQTFGSWTGSLGPGKYQVEEVLGRVSDIAARDESLDALDAPGAVVLRDCLCSACAYIGSRVWFGEHHRPGPSALESLFGPMFLLFVPDGVEHASPSVDPMLKKLADPFCRDQHFADRPDQRCRSRNTTHAFW